MAFELCFSGLGFVWLGGRVSRFGRKSNRSTAPNPKEHEFSRERIFHTIRFAICIASKRNTFLCDGELGTPLPNQAEPFDFHSCS